MALPRGYMLDISRTKVPQTNELEKLILCLSRWGYQWLELYTEHTFAFSGHELVWGDASPLTADEVRHLDRFARNHGVELVPSFNTLGHWERWLKHPEYRHLAECPFGWRRPDGHGMLHGSTLCPGPEAEALLADLLAELLPCFSSGQANLGGDEPWELGMGKSRDRCEAEGRQVVYAKHLATVAKVAQRHGKRPAFWADIVLQAPEVIAQLPRETRLLVWGYDAERPWDRELDAVKAAGREAIVCPGTSGWNSLIGRLGNASANLAGAVTAAERHQAMGLLVTDWGDMGHHQFPWVSAVPLALAAPPADPTDLDAAANRAADDWFGGGRVGAALARCAVALGQLSARFPQEIPNANAFHLVWRAPHATLRAVLPQFDPGVWAEVGGELSETEAVLTDLLASPNVTYDQRLTAREMRCNTQMARWAAGRALAFAPRGPHPAAPSLVELRRLGQVVLGEFETLWLARNRPGGLHESSARIRRVLASDPTEPPRAAGPEPMT